MYAIVDIETTGGSPKVEKITEIAVYIHNGTKVVDSFESLINPEKYIPPYITRITGITNEMVGSAPKFYEIARKIVEITQGNIFVAHNVDFDYKFIREEFKRLGYDFRRKKLCTVKLSRKLIPGQKTYSLGRLCENIGIEIENRHRAAGDALATVQLFELLLQLDTRNKPVFAQMQSNTTNFPPQLNKEKIEKLPERTGVYYFYNDKGRIIYIGKSKQIRTRVFSHLAGMGNQRTSRMLEQVTDIGFELTGSELIALLKESEEIKSHKPLFNRAQRRSVTNYGLYSWIDENHYIRFKIERNNNSEIPLTSFNNKQEARKHLELMIEKMGLCQKLCGLYKTQAACFQYEINLCKGACIQEESHESYNLRAERLIKKYSFHNQNFLIIDKGRHKDEKSIIRIANGKYVGFGYVDNMLQAQEPGQLFENIQSKEDNREVQQIIKNYLHNHTVEKIIKL